MPRRTMAERREVWRADMAAQPLYWEGAYGWLRTELRDLDRACRSSILLRLRTRRARHSVRLKAAVVLLCCAMEMDAAIPAEGDEANRRERRRREVTGAADADEFMWRAKGWLMSSEGFLGDTVLRERCHATATAALVSLAESVAGIRKGA